MKELLEYLLEKLTGTSDSAVAMEEDDYTFKFMISAPAEYIPTIIGRSGRTINSLRSLLSVYDALNQKTHKKIFLSIDQ